jgi:V/A-type H+-transporting ATPase subunit E
MDHKLQEITDKLFQEGVVKGSQKAEELLADANKKAQQVIADAEQKAQQIVAEAQKKAEELDKNVKSELQLASRQMVNALEQEVANLITGAIVSDAVQPAITDKEFLQKLIMAAVTNWAPKQDLLVVVSPEDKPTVEAYFSSQAKQLLNSGLTIQSVNKVKTGFQIGPVDGSFKVSFSNEDFISFFKEFIRPKIVELLFDRK